MARRLDPLGRSPFLRRLRERARSGDLPQSLLLIGPEGSAKEFAAMELARTVLCARGDAGPCDDAEVCAPCRKCRQLAHPDLLYAFPAEASLTMEGYRELVALRAAEPLRRLPQPSSAILSVGAPDDPPPGSIRAIRRFVGGKPFEGNRRVVIVGDAHRMNRAAANALLKTLEEPPPASMLLLVTHQPHLLPSTVRSRCGRVQFPPLSPSDLASHLEAAYDLEPAEAAQVAGVASGNARRALDLLDPVARELAEWASTVLGWLVQGDLPALLRAAEKIPKGQDPRGGKGSRKGADGGLAAARDLATRVLDYVVADLVSLARLSTGASLDPLQESRLAPLRDQLDPSDAGRRAKLLMAARADLLRNVNVALVLTDAFTQASRPARFLVDRA